MRYVVLLMGVASILAGTVTAKAGLILNSTGGGSASVAFEGGTSGTSSFSNPAQNFGPSNLSNVIIEKTFDSLAPIVFDDVTFDSADLNFTGGFRWTERINNNTGADWFDFHLTLSDTSGTWFTDLPLFTPGLVTINDGGSISASSGVNTVTRIPGEGIISDDKKEIWFFFDTPVAHGSFVDLHTAIEGLTLTEGSGSFQLSQIPTVPEPSSLALLFTGTMGLIAYRGRRRKQRVA